MNIAKELDLTKETSKNRTNVARTGCRAPVRTCLILALFLYSLAIFGHAQDASNSPAPTNSTNDTSSRSGDDANNVTANKQDKDAQDEVPKRILWIIPNFMTANDQPENRGPLTTRQKYSIAWHQFVDPSAHFGNLLQAGISQAADGIPHYGQGWGAFGQRFLAQEGDQFTGSFLIYGVLPQLLRQDPRYFRKGAGSPFARIGYAASRVLIARSDSGHTVFNAAQVFGQLGQAGISLTYYPEQDRDVRGLFVGWAVNQGYNIGWNQLKEFSPDLGAYMRRRSQRNRLKKLQAAHSDTNLGDSHPAPDPKQH